MACGRCVGRGRGGGVERLFRVRSDRSAFFIHVKSFIRTLYTVKTQASLAHFAKGIRSSLPGGGANLRPPILLVGGV